jgi:VWFA-related protein
MAPGRVRRVRATVYKPTTTLILLAFVGTSIIGQQPQPPAPAQGTVSAQVAPDSQMPPITFRTEVNYVEVDAVVLDQQGRFIRDLRRDELQILEDGKPQALTTFSLVDIPVTRADRPLFSPRAIEPDVRSNVGEPDGRIYVIVLDDTHVNLTRSARVRIAVKQFIERNLGANDLAAVVHTSGRQEAGQDFTNNRRLLLEAVDKFMGKRLRSPTQEKLDEYYRTRGTPLASNPITDPVAFERSYNARNVLATLKSIADMLSGVSGRRKALVFVSEGIDYDITDFMNNHDAVTIIDETRDAIGAATRANVNIYAIDPRGLTALGEDGIEMMAPPEDPSLRLDMTGLANDLRTAQDSLRVLSDETGGFAAVNANDFSSAFQESSTRTARTT